MFYLKSRNYKRMTYYVLVLIVISLCVSSLTFSCGPNEYEVNCTPSCGQDCPKNEYSDRICQNKQTCGQPTCNCVFNYRRHENGTCIPTTSCDPFPCTRPYEMYVSCPESCPTDDCTQATPDGICPYFGFMLPVVSCSPSCRCIEGYWRHNGECVPYDKCPQKWK